MEEDVLALCPRPSSSPLSPFVSCYSTPGVGWFGHNHWNISTEQSLSYCHTAQRFSFADGQIKNVSVRAPVMDPCGDLCAVIWKQPCHMWSPLREGVFSVNKMMYHLVWINDNLMSHPQFHCLLPVPVNPMSIKLTSDWANWCVRLPRKTLTSSDIAGLEWFDDWQRMPASTKKKQKKKPIWWVHCFWKNTVRSPTGSSGCSEMTDQSACYMSSPLT